MSFRHLESGSDRVISPDLSPITAADAIQDAARQAYSEYIRLFPRGDALSSWRRTAALEAQIANLEPLEYLQALTDFRCKQLAKIAAWVIFSRYSNHFEHLMLLHSSGFEYIHPEWVRHTVLLAQDSAFTWHAISLGNLVDKPIFNDFFDVFKYSNLTTLVEELQQAYSPNHTPTKQIWPTATEIVRSLVSHHQAGSPLLKENPRSKLWQILSVESAASHPSRVVRSNWEDL